jgi:ABC-type antimicrobial peptide transport system permease subunit
LVPDTKYLSLREAYRPVVYLCTAQEGQDDPFDQLVVRSGLPPAALIPGLRRAAAEVSPAISVDFQPFERTIREGLLAERLMATLSSFFGILAALLAGIGLYGVIWYMVLRRTNEIGIRMTLGAGRRDILALILGEAGRLAVVGLAAGSALALIAGRAAAKMLYGLEPNDGLMLAAATLLLAAVALAAGYLPARRAAGLEPMAALRYE